MEFEPTDEQLHVLDVFNAGESMVVKAGAGTGKTATLKLLALEAARADRAAGMPRGRRFQYTARGKAIVLDARQRMPSNTRCHTAHGLAMSAAGRPFQHRLGSDRMRSSEIAKILRLDPLRVTYGGKPKFLAPARLAGITIRTVKEFCKTTDPEPTVEHVPVLKGIDIPGEDTNTKLVAAHILPALRRAWDDLQNPSGALPYFHNAYLKCWQLRPNPRISADVIFFDEAQDADAVMADIVARQTHAQLVYVGDENQAIFEWAGAVDALSKFETDRQARLSQSFRFGPEIAAVANEVLGWLGTDLRLRGLDSLDSRVGPFDCQAVLCRTNAEAVTQVLRAQQADRRAHLVGGAEEVLVFADGAEALMAGLPTTHPDLACFDSWPEVIEYVAEDAQGYELKLLVDLVVEFGVDVIRAALADMVPEPYADVIVSTAHKAKGREWLTVRLAGDFPDVDEGGLMPEELRLLYVAVTRARMGLDITAMPVLIDGSVERLAFEKEVAAAKAGLRGLAARFAPKPTESYGNHMIGPHKLNPQEPQKSGIAADGAPPAAQESDIPAPGPWVPWDAETMAAITEVEP